MVSRGFKWIGKTTINGLTVVIDQGCFAMHDSVGAYDFSAKGCRNRLMPQTHTEQWDFLAETDNRLDRDAGASRRARARRYDDCRRSQVYNSLEVYLIISGNLDVLPDDLKHLNQVVSK
jgi:hypothetical protein